MATVDDDIRNRYSWKTFNKILLPSKPEPLEEHLKLLDAYTVKVNGKGVEEPRVLVGRCFPDIGDWSHKRKITAL